MSVAVLLSDILKVKGHLRKIKPLLPEDIPIDGKELLQGSCAGLRGAYMQIQRLHNNTISKKVRLQVTCPSLLRPACPTGMNLSACGRHAPEGNC